MNLIPKIKYISSHLILFLLIIFVLSKSLSLFHVVSHGGQDVFAKWQADADLEKKSSKDSKQSPHDCATCSCFFFHHQLLLSKIALTLFAVFCAAFFSRRFDRVKLSYPLSSNPSRAPPLVF